MKKINIEKNEGVAEIIDKIYNEPDKEVTLIIMNNSVLLKSPRNFQILKKEIENAGRIIVIESVDENILSLAKENGIDHSHPLWNSSSDGRFSDIIKDKKEDEEEYVSNTHKKISINKVEKKEPVKIKISENSNEEDEDESELEYKKHDDADEEKEAFYSSKDDRWKKWSKGNDSSEEVETYEEKEEPEKKISSRNNFFKDTIIPKDDDDSDDNKINKKKVFGYVFLSLILIGGVFFGVPYFFGSVKINLNFIKTPFEYTNSVIADKSVSTIDYSNNTIPAQIFVSNKNVTQLFKATGNANISQKATGIITIYNNFSSSPQTLVATTRFTTPDGKIFRLVNQVIVPGAQVTNGNIVPSSIDVPIIADQAGDSYNVSNISKLTIPGFQGTKKYDGFYGAISSSTIGGFVGNKAVPNSSDISAAKSKMTDILNSAFSTSIKGTYPDNFIILDGATSTVITKLSVNTSTDNNGNFSVFGEAVFTAIGFDKNNLNTLLLSNASTSSSQSSTFSDVNINYSNIKPDFSNGKINFSVDAKGDTEAYFSQTDFVNNILGKDFSSVRLLIASVPGITNGSIDGYPAWLSSVPDNKNRIKLSIN